MGTDAGKTDEGAQERGPGVIGWGLRANRVRSAWGWWSWLSGGGAGNATMSVAGAAMVAAAAGTVAFDGVRTAWGVPGAISVQPVSVAERQTLGSEAILYQVNGTDQSGKKATFDLIVLSQDTVWVKGKIDEIARGDKVLAAADFRKTMAGGAVGQRIAAARELIAVGVASREGDQSTEEARAGQRAQRIGSWLAEVDSSKKPIWLLNLGQHRSDCIECDQGVTDWQRPIIVIGLTTADQGVNLGEALADAMTNRANLPSPESYSSFRLARLR